MLKVLNCLFEPRIAGPAIRVAGVAGYLAEEGIETVAVLPDVEGPVAELMESSGLKVCKLRFHKPPRPTSPKEILSFLFALPGDVWRFRRLFREEKADIVHVNAAVFPQPAIAARLAGVKLVWHMNDTILPKPMARGAGLFVRALAQAPVAAAGAVATHYGLKKASVLYAPVDTERFNERGDHALPQDGPITIGMVGNWNNIKGQERFVRVVAGLRDRLGREVRGVMIGRVLDNHKAHYDAVMEEARSLGVADSLDKRGFDPNPREAMGEFDLQILPSHSEACPMSVLEAMSVGIPVIAFEVGGVREQIDREGQPAGLVVPKGDCEAMADAAAQVLGDPKSYAEMARNGQSLARAVFAVSKVADAHAAVYRRVTG